jgi:hypothetical protein
MRLSMTSAANQQTYRAPAWGAPTWNQPGGPWGPPGSENRPPSWVPASGISRSAGIALMVLGFIFWWPVGLAALFYMIWSKKMGCGRRYRQAAQTGEWGGAPPWAAWKSWATGTGAPPTSGNHAFDEYRSETLRRLEDEQKEFTAFLERLRFAKDKAEFDQFMAERRSRPPAPSTEDHPSA